MSISPLPLPSNPKVKVHFKTPKVSDAIAIAERNPAYEEAIANQYLKDIQDASKNKGGEVFDPGYWTVEDRKVALIWIFAGAREDPSISVSYDCAVCQEKHYVDIKVPDLLEMATTISGKAQRPIEFLKEGVLIKGYVKPINGYEAEHLEQLRMLRDGHKEDTPEYRKQNIELHMTEHAHFLRLNDEPKDDDEALNYRLNLLKEMDLDTEFRSLAAKIETALREMRHGVPVRYQDGQYLIIHKIVNCEHAVAKGESESKDLLLPFWAHDFFPEL